MEQISSSEWQEKVLEAQKPVLVDFMASWCGPCKAMAPIIDEIADELKDSVDVYQFDIDEDYDVATNLKILSVPTFIVYKGGEEHARRVGSQSKGAILEMLA